MTKMFATITKIDPDKRIVEGYASTEVEDSQGEIITRNAIEGALAGYMKFGNIREMHQPSAVGKTTLAEMDEKGLKISVKVVDDNAWKKVKEGVYNGFSIGGNATKKDGNKIEAMDLTEISLVDRPACPEALFTLWKAEKGNPTMKKSHDELAELKAKFSKISEDIAEALKSLDGDASHDDEAKRKADEEAAAAASDEEKRKADEAEEAKRKSEGSDDEEAKRKSEEEEKRKADEAEEAKRKSEEGDDDHKTYSDEDKEHLRAVYRMMKESGVLDDMNKEDEEDQKRKAEGSDDEETKRKSEEEEKRKSDESEEEKRKGEQTEEKFAKALGMKSDTEILKAAGFSSVKDAISMIQEASKVIKAQDDHLQEISKRVAVSKGVLRVLGRDGKSEDLTVEKMVEAGANPADILAKMYTGELKNEPITKFYDRD